jgi:hypothetical protein
MVGSLHPYAQFALAKFKSYEFGCANARRRRAAYPPRSSSSRIPQFSSVERFPRSLVLVALCDRCRVHHRIHRIHLAATPRISHQGRNLCVCQSRCRRDPRIFPRRRTPRHANDSRNLICSLQRSGITTTQARAQLPAIQPQEKACTGEPA